MKHLLLTTIAAVLVVGCGPSVDIWTAANKGNIEAVKQHLDAGADVNAKNNKIVKYTPLHAAAGGGRMEVAELLIAKGADVNAKGHEGWTPLHEVRVKEIAELLIAKGADVNAKNSDGSTPLQIAALRGFKEIAELLIVAGADVNAQMNNGNTPLDWADDKETADLLRKHGGKRGAELKAAGN
jgi:ankyrin repeat protein